MRFTVLLLFAAAFFCDFAQAYIYYSPNIGVFFRRPDWCTNFIGITGIPYQSWNYPKLDRARLISDLYSLYVSAMDGVLERDIIPVFEYGVMDEFLLSSYDDFNRFDLDGCGRNFLGLHREDDGVYFLCRTNESGHCSRRMSLYNQYQAAKARMEWDVYAMNGVWNLGSSSLCELIPKDCPYDWPTVWSNVVADTRIALPWYTYLRLALYQSGDDIIDTPHTMLQNPEAVCPAPTQALYFLKLQPGDEDYMGYNDLCPTITDLMATNDLFFSSLPYKSNTSRMVAEDVASVCSLLSLADQSYRSLAFGNASNYDHSVSHRQLFSGTIQDPSNNEFRVVVSRDWFDAPWRLVSPVKLVLTNDWTLITNDCRETYTFRHLDDVCLFRLNYFIKQAEFSATGNGDPEFNGVYSMSFADLYNRLSAHLSDSAVWELTIHGNDGGVGAHISADPDGDGIFEDIVILSTAANYPQEIVFTVSDVFRELKFDKDEWVVNGFEKNTYESEFYAAHRPLYNRGILAGVSLDAYDALFGTTNLAEETYSNINESDCEIRLYRQNPQSSGPLVIDSRSPDQSIYQFGQLADDHLSSVRSMYDNWCIDMLSKETELCKDGIDNAMIAATKGFTMNLTNASLVVSCDFPIESLVISNNQQRSTCIRYRTGEQSFISTPSDDLSFQVGSFSLRLIYGTNLVNSSMLPISIHSRPFGAMTEHWSWGNMRRIRSDQ